MARQPTKPDRSPSAAAATTAADAAGVATAAETAGGAAATAGTAATAAPTAGAAATPVAATGAGAGGAPAPVFVLDGTVVVDGSVTEAVRAGRFDGATVVVPEVVLADIEAQAAENLETGVTALDGIRRLREACDARGVALAFDGERPRDPGRLRASGMLEALARDLAEQRGAVLVTSSAAQAAICAARGTPVLVFDRPPLADVASLGLMRYFDATTMSVHLRARTRPRAKRGTPGSMRLDDVGDVVLGEREVERLAREVVGLAERHPEGFIESDSGGSTVVQLADLRIAIARPPFADAVEITAVRPVARTRLDDYRHADLLRERLRARHRGVLVSGAPGAGKSTFVQAIADDLEAGGWLIKTMEKPRDLVLSDEITQYTALDGDMANTADVLLLVRPDYTIFDEMRRTEDFRVFADMRLAGVGLVGVVHATRGIDALQRMVGRIELGVIPQVIDTVVFIDAGDVREVFETEYTVKVPTGMGDEGLARPVIEVRDHETQQLAYEMYTFGEQVVVMPLGEGDREKAVWRHAARGLEELLARLWRTPVAVEVRSDQRAEVFVDPYLIPEILGRGGRGIREVEADVGLRLTLLPIQAHGGRGGRRGGHAGRDGGDTGGGDDDGGRGRSGSGRPFERRGKRGRR